MKKIILGITASISAYKACDLARNFVKEGYDVHVVITNHALKLITALTFETLTGNKVYTEDGCWERGEMGHIELKDDAALYVIAPATANIIGKLANGIADDLVSTTFLSVKCPVLVAPAMNPNMYSHWSVQENIKKLSEHGVKFVEPTEGLVACGDEGKGKLAEVEDIFKVAIDVIDG